MKKILLTIVLLLTCQNICTQENKGFFEKIKDKLTAFYLTAKNAIEAKIIKPVSEDSVQKLAKKVYQQSIQIINSFKDSLLSVKQSILKEYKFVAKPAIVRTGSPVGPEEKIFLQNREKVVKSTLENLGIKINKTPKIALCGSGGGVRAAISFLGFLNILEKHNLINSASYVSALSGSTWTTAPWLMKGNSVSEFKKYFKERTTKGMGPIAKGEQIQKFIKSLLAKILFLQAITPVDIYGGLLSNFLLQNFDPERHKVHFSNLAPNLLKGSIPMPILTTVITGLSHYEWVEINPFEIGSTYLNAFVPTWGFGREFSKGKSTDFAPEQSLGYLLGICGSAFEASMMDIIKIQEKELQQESPLLKGIMKTLEDVPGTQTRIWPASVFNFTYEFTGPLAKKKNISLLDAGIDFNLAVPPLLERDLDLIIVCDASDSKIGTQIDSLIKYMKRKSYKYPAVNFKHLQEKRIYVFECENCGPTIIYMPVLNENGEYLKGYDWKKEKYAQTINFKYSPEEFDKFIGLTEFNTEKSIPAIKEMIQKIASK